MIPVPKPIRHESEEYKEFIRDHPCINCGRLAQCHHEAFNNGGMGTKCSDSQSLPLCFECHIEGRHRHGYSWYEQHGIDPKLEIIKLNAEYMHLKGV